MSGLSYGCGLEVRPVGFLASDTLQQAQRQTLGGVAQVVRATVS
jgi:hypothetical protein